MLGDVDPSRTSLFWQVGPRAKRFERTVGLPIRSQSNHHSLCRSPGWPNLDPGLLRFRVDGHYLGAPGGLAAADDLTVEHGKKSVGLGESGRFGVGELRPA